MMTVTVMPEFRRVLPGPRKGSNMVAQGTVNPVFRN